MSVPLFVELCAGTAALSLALHGGLHARPPVSRMGSKRGYARAILRVLGLRPGQGADHYLWCEPDAGCRMLLEAYRDAALAREAATIIRSWADEEPRALWERLRAEGPALHEVDAREVARWLTVGQLSYRQMEPSSGFNPGMATDSPSPCWRPDLASVAAALPACTLPATIAPDARRVDAREVARWVNTEAWSNGGRYMGPDRPSSCHPAGWVASITSAGISSRLAALPTLPATIAPDARAVEPGPMSGVIVYCDPPYQGTTGYADDLPRDEVVALLTRWHEAGATVAVSEACGFADLLPGEWWEVDITGERDGQKRTFSKQQREVLTLNRRPAWVPAVQGVLF